MNVDIVVKKTAKAAPHRMAAPHSPPFKQRFGAWGRVYKVYSNNHTADVYLDTGVFLKQVPVSSKEWVKPGDDYTTGERDLPPENARVFVFMPYGDYDGCFVLCSGFVVTDKAQKQAFMEDEKERIRKRVWPGNWKSEYHYETGTYDIISPDEKTRLKIDYGTEQEAKDPHELHLLIFHDEENNDPGIKLDFVSGKTIDLYTFDDIVFHHEKGKSISLEERIDKNYTNKANVTNSIEGNKTEDVVGNYKHTSADTDIESTAPVGVKGTNTQLGNDVLQVFFDDLIKAVTRNPIVIPPVPWPKGTPVPPAPPIINMFLNGVIQDIVAAAIKAKESCAKALK
jgi:hypothetical protein